VGRAGDPARRGRRLASLAARSDGLRTAGHGRHAPGAEGLPLLPDRGAPRVRPGRPGGARPRGLPGEAASRLAAQGLSATPLKRTPLYQAHVKAGARMVPFGGWEMPVQYTGIIEEH